MGLVFTRKAVETSQPRHRLAIWLALTLLAAGFSHLPLAAQPVLSPPVWGTNPVVAQITLSNCSDTNSEYVTQMSTNLINWVSVATNNPANTNFAVTIPTAGPVNFYRVVALPVLGRSFGVAIATVSSFNANFNNVSVDSFDSSNTNYSTNGQWVASKRKANGNVLATAGLIGDTTLGSVDIYGHLYTGPGTTEAADAQIGTHGAVGDLAWIQGGNTGVESNYWMGNFSTIFPDVPAPSFVGSALPPPQTSGIFAGDIVLAGGNYTTTTGGAPTQPLVVTSGPVSLWIQGSFTPVQIIFTNGGSLVLYLGTSTGSGDSLTFENEFGSINSPGYAANLQIFGLPSLQQINLARNAGFIGAIYAPKAAFYAGGGGAQGVDSSGSLIVYSVRVNDHWNFHFDENLIATGPHH